MMPTDSDDDKRVTFRMDEEKVNAFDDKIIELKHAGKLDRDTTRSEMIRKLMEEFTTGNSTGASGRPETVMATAAN